jgi:hypothetical protein
MMPVKSKGDINPKQKDILKAIEEDLELDASSPLWDYFRSPPSKKTKKTVLEQSNTIFYDLSIDNSPQTKQPQKESVVQRKTSSKVDNSISNEQTKPKRQKLSEEEKLKKQEEKERQKEEKKRQQEEIKQRKEEERERNRVKTLDECLEELSVIIDTALHLVKRKFTQIIYNTNGNNS